MKKEEIDNLILGGGVSGMSCAMELYNHDKKCLVIEKENKVGGLAKTLSFKEEGELNFKTDIGPHRFFSKKDYLYKFVKNILDDDWILVNRKTRQFIDGKFYDYPIKPIQAFKNVGLVKTLKIIFSYLKGYFTYNIFNKKIENFEDFIVANFGRELGEFNMLNYTEKIWGLDSRKIHCGWAKQRIKGLNLLNIFKDLFIKMKNDSPKSLVNCFYYPKYGSGFLYESIEKKISDRDNYVKKKSFPTKIIHKENHILEVLTNIEGNEKLLRPNNLITSIPYDNLLNILSPKPPKKVFEASNDLNWRSQVYLFITLDKEKVTDDNWIYFPNKNIPFGRISEMKNFSKDMSPKNKTSLFVEFFVDKGDKIWKMNADNLFNLALKHLSKLGFFKREDVRNYYVFKKEKVYPVYDLNYKSNLEVIKNYLNMFDNLYYIGRLGRFHYTNQDHSIEMGILAARSIIKDEKYDFERIVSDSEYFEKGEIDNEYK